MFMFLHLPLFILHSLTLYASIKSFIWFVYQVITLHFIKNLELIFNVYLSCSMTCLINNLLIWHFICTPICGWICALEGVIGAFKIYIFHLPSKILWRGCRNYSPQYQITEKIFVYTTYVCIHITHNTTHIQHTFNLFTRTDIVSLLRLQPNPLSWSYDKNLNIGQNYFFLSIIIIIIMINVVVVVLIIIVMYWVRCDVICGTRSYPTHGSLNTPDGYLQCTSNHYHLQFYVQHGSLKWEPQHSRWLLHRAMSNH